MFIVWTSLLFAFVITFLMCFECADSREEVTSKFLVSKSIHMEDEANQSKNSTERKYRIEESDYVEVSSVKNYDTGYIEYIDFVPGINVINETNSRVVINKCCGSNYYFDVDNFTCVHLQENLTNPYLFLNKKRNGKNEFNYLFIESMPACGNKYIITVEVTSRVLIDMTGAVLEGERNFSRYCIDGSLKNPLEAVVLTCRDPTAFCKTRTCFRKCCPLGHSYGLPERKCRKSNEPFRPEFYNPNTLTLVNSTKLYQFGIYLGDACGTKGKYLLERDVGEISYLSVDGTLFAPSFEKQTLLESEFCVEVVKTKNYSRVETFLCFSKTGTHFENSQLQFFLLSLGFIISCMFLLLTFLVYLFSPKSQNLYGKTLMCYIFCLFVAYLCLAVIELRSEDIDKFVCTILGYSLLFFFLAAFFWLNVMSFDIWKTFRLDRTVERSKADNRQFQFFWYSVYAWGFPSLLTGFCAYVNQAQSSPFEVIKPDIGEENCWFSKKKKGIYVFFIAPISLIIAFNIIFYIRTARKIWKVKSDVNKIEKQKINKFAANKEQFIINGKLFIVMGVTWSLEIISYFAPHPIWYVTDAANALHGVFIFVVFVFKKKVLRQVSQQVRAPLKRVRQLTTFSSDGVSTRKNFQDLNAERKSSSNGISAVFRTDIKN